MLEELTSLLRAFVLGLKEGFTDLINWHKPPRTKPDSNNEKTYLRYFSNAEWRFWSVKELTAQLVVILTLLILIREGIGEFRYIPSESMEPTMHIKDKLFVEKFSKIFCKQYQRGDIVIFYPPASSSKDGKDVIKNDPISIFARLTGLPFLPQPEAYIKRIIALPGDRIAIKRNQGVFINGHHLEEPYHFGSNDYLPEYDIQEIVVPQDHYYLLGDNRNESYDSHYWGFLPKERVIGRAAFLIYRPLDMKPSF
jgi:signal peptidase I